MDELPYNPSDPIDPNFPPSERKLFETYAGSVAYVCVETLSNEQAMGTCFHIGSNVFITARHVVEGNRILKIANTAAGIRHQPGGMYVANYLVRAATAISEPFYHSDDRFDVAALKIEGITCPVIPLAPIMADKFGNDLIMAPTVIMGFPRVFGSIGPVLVCAKGEVNAHIENYLNKQRMYIISCLARGGFSGGPVLLPPHDCIGVITDSLFQDKLPEELGYMAVTGCLPIYELLDKHKIMPPNLYSYWLGYQKYKDRW